MKKKYVAGILALSVLIGGTATAAYADDDTFTETEITKSLLAEYGVDQDAVQTAETVFSDARKQYEDAEIRFQIAEKQLQEVSARLASANEELGRLDQRAKTTVKEIEKSESEIGVMASSMYKNSGISDNLIGNYLLSDQKGDVAEAMNGQYMMAKIMGKRSGTVENKKQLLVTQEADKLRQAAVEQQITDMKATIQASVDDAEEKRRQADSDRKKYEESLKNAQQAATDAKTRYLDAVTKAKADEAAFKKKQEAMLRLQQEEDRRNKVKSKGYSTSDAGKYVPSSGDGVFPLPLPTGISRVTSNFGFRSTPAGTIDYGGKGGYVHAGIDYGAACGTPVHAVADGEVWLAGSAGTSGIAVGLNHGVVEGFAFATRYHHLSSVRVIPGEQVKRGQLIGISGTTGNSNGCHLHFETMVNGEKVNPVSFLR